MSKDNNLHKISAECVWILTCFFPKLMPFVNQFTLEYVKPIKQIMQLYRIGALENAPRHPPCPTEALC